MTPARGLVTLRRIETPESLPGGRIVLTPTTREGLTSHQMEVIAVGAPSLCENEDCERPHVYSTTDWDAYHMAQVSAGDWVLVRHRSLTATHEAGLYCCAQDDILAVLEP